MEALSSKRMTFDGVDYIVDVVRDDSGESPWNREDGHGEVTEWVRRDKKPGELVLMKDRGSFRYYDYAGAMETAKKDGWGHGPDVAGETPAQKAHRAVMADYARLKAFCDNEWEYVGVVVYPINEDDEPRRKWGELLWGIESDSGDEYFADIAKELAGEVAARFAAKH